MTNEHTEELGVLSDFVDAVVDQPRQSQIEQAQHKLMARLATASKRQTLTWWPKMSLASAAAAAVAMFAMIGFWPGEQQLALASVVEKLNHITSFRAVTTTQQGEQTLTQVTSDFRAPGQVRIELADSLSMILDLPSATLLAINHNAKQYRLSDIGEPGGFQLETQESFRFLEQLKQIETGADTVLARQLVNGKWSVGFVVNIQGNAMTLWAEELTGLPVALEVISNLGEQQTLQVKAQYEFEVSFPDDHFSLEPPLGYTSD
ncbi:MAG: hypothetical protein AAF438_11545 [Pseudomonadota bacterium]